ncbi:MAG: transcription-repair coupling factor [Acidaminococcus sp.]|jgi:transcription-repair coupling factor (superfamily II helicase)|nr:transcription-repair coupling factor [Acidaminococcus sp.]MCI2100594.1 transcription-repair coupling factor [Acidaminococcus sp.]MCI2114915.1 transcription-repair coupling factor [Acidaminococcus sp.]MCI2116941.1 transcription-repair coupling factor [Acidaminococcus sp.]
MEQELIKLLLKEKNIRKGIDTWRRTSGPLTFTGLTGSVKAGFLAAMMTGTRAEGPLVILTANRENVRNLRRELTYFYPDLAMRELYPASLVHGQVDTRNEEVMAERAASLEMIAKEEPGIIFVTAEAAIQKLPSPENFFRKNITVTSGAEIDRDELIEKLVKEGYERTDQVDTIGQISVRGDILDIFPINQKDPIRMEWFDNTVDAIRRFNLADQRSIGGLTRVDIMPIAQPENEASSDIFAYVKEEQFFVLDEPAAFFEEAKKSYNDNREFADQLFTEKELEERGIKGHVIVVSDLGHKFAPKAPNIHIQVRSMAPYNKNTELLVKDLKGWIADGVHPLIMMGTRDKAFGVAQELKNQGVPMQFVRTGTLLPETGGAVFEGSLSRGFNFWDENWLLLTEADIFGMQKQRRQRKQRGKGPSINYFSDIKVGDYVVHDTQGIGRYLGVETIVIDGVHRDYLKLQYAKGDKLHVPIEQVGLLHKYVGSEGTPPRLSNMGRSDWQRTKKKAKKAITLLASELLRLYAQRKITKGHAFSPDTPWQKEFEAQFPYEETPDQLQAIREIKADMEKPVPMDRLLCGDVGYGKTEVAIRAAFKAVMDGKQVAVMAPTTVLAQQHLLTFRQRMENFGVRIDMLSRFRTPKEQKAILKKLEEGQLDIIIGTHRLLQPDVHFKDIGLLVIDEEQRFGVAQKEKIKQWSAGIDVLTLSATPIPRTLHLALVKGRDMSVIESPPEDRLPVETYVAEYDEGMVKEAIEREIRRGGRVYYVHNRIEGLSSIAARLRELVPGITIGIGHGRMTEDELEDVMMGFYQGDFDVLLCTTIIENGLDVPLANTIIIDGAENFGLSQLYQMRGRVGRSSRLAYAYFLYKKDRALTEIAQKRLQAIRDFTELGAGFKIAMRDLEIRGAGNLLGPEQHGQIAGVGFDLYCRLLEDTINALQSGKTAEEQVPDPVIDMKLDAYIPDDYIDNPRYKLEIYHRLADMKYEESKDFMDEIIDRFGTPPEQMVLLWRVAALRDLCRKLRIIGISVRPGAIRITFDQHSTANPDVLKDMLREYVPRATLKMGSQPLFTLITTGMKIEPLTWLEKNIPRLL